MTYKTILVQLDAAAAASRYDIAATIAARSGGCLSGVYLKTTLINQYNDIGSIGYLPPEDLDQMIREHNQGQDNDAEKSAAVMARSAAKEKAHCDWRVVSGDAPDPLIAEARRADLTVLPPPSPEPAYNVHASAIDIALGSGGPVLVVPAKVNRTRLGERVLLAWNGSREAARALRDALPLLADKAVVEVRMVRSATQGEGDAVALRRHLERHGLAVNIKIAADKGQSISAWLEAEAVATDCDMVIMGLYGHTRLREFILGGVSRDMLHTSALPLLMSH